MTSVRQIITAAPILSAYEQERLTARLAAIAQVQHEARGIIKALERSFGVTRAYPMTRHALALLDAADAAGREAK